jgi:hypothetical protein
VSAEKGRRDDDREAQRKPAQLVERAWASRERASPPASRRTAAPTTTT